MVEADRPQRRGDRGQRARSAAWRRGWRRASTRLRVASGVTSAGAKRERPSDQRTPWLGLLLWAFACAGLFVSLVIERGEWDREPRLAAHNALETQLSTTSSPVGWQISIDQPELSLAE
jgi:hypothetical protein